MKEEDSPRSLSFDKKKQLKIRKTKQIIKQTNKQENKNGRMEFFVQNSSQRKLHGQGTVST